MDTILSILVENKPGILFKITNLFRSRNFNIESISVGVTIKKEFSRMTINTRGDEKQIQQIIKQLNKMIDTIEVKRFKKENSVYKEIILLKIANKKKFKKEIYKISNTYNAKIYDHNSESLIIELTEEPNTIKSLEKKLKKYNIIDIARTGIVALENDQNF